MSRMNYALMVKLRAMRRLYLLSVDGIADSDMAVLLNIHRQDVWRLRHMLNTLEVSRGRYTAVPDDEDVLFAEAIRWRHNEERKRDAAD